MSKATVGGWRRDLAVISGALALLALILVPLPGLVLDVALALNLAVGLLLVIVAARARSIGALRALPTALLLATVARVAIEVAATRAILTRGDVGALIPSVGRAALGGDWVTGVAVFAVLVGVQYAVIARGSERVAEVAARFALDAVPGRQMSLDAATRGGLVDGAQAARERDAIANESAFHAAMDGAARFVRGDSLAGALIAAVNLLGGASVGALRDGLGPLDAMARYGSLAVGQGLLAQLPSLACAVAAALAVTRAQRDEGVVEALADSLFGDVDSLRVLAVLVAAIGLFPGLPLAPFAVAGFSLAALGSLGPREDRAAMLVLEAPAPEASRARRMVAEVLHEAEEALGVEGPGVTVLRAGGRWRLVADGVAGAPLDDLGAARAELRRFILDRPSRWFGVEATRRWIDEQTRRAPTLTSAVVPGRLSAVELSTLLGALLDGGAPLHQTRAALERIASSPKGISPQALVEQVREALREGLVARWGRGRTLRVVEVSALVADAALDAHRRLGEGTLGASLRRDLGEALDAMSAPRDAVFVTSSAARAAVERALREAGCRSFVLCWEEIEGCEIDRVGRLG